MSLPESATGAVQSAPANEEEARSLMQARLGQFGRIGAIVATMFFAIDIVLILVFPRMLGARVSISAQVASAFVAGSVWAITRMRPFGMGALGAIDTIATICNCMVFVAMGWGLPIWARPDMIQLLCVTEILMVRAFLVPSTTKKTATLATAMVIVIAVSTWIAYSAERPNPAAPGPGPYTSIAGIFGLATIIVTSLTSRTIFGLRQKVREAFQLGQYTLLEKVGEGGMGVVYKARHAMLRRPTAVKLLHADRTGQHNLARFEREVQLTSLLTHPNTVSIYDYGRTADGILYYAMEFLDGVDLQALVELVGPQEPGRVIVFLRQICGALAQAHGVGLIHRDVKPANVFLCPRSGDGDLVKVLDFGLVRSVDGSSDAARTGDDQLVGSPLYMSPEAIVSPDKVDARSDLYAVGALGYFLIVGEAPFSGRSAVEVCGHHLHTAPVAPSVRLGRAISSQLETLILQCLAKSPDARPADARSLLRALDECTDVPAWTVQRADEWWRVHEELLRARRGGRDRQVPESGPGATLAVDLRRRQAHEPAGIPG